MSTFFHNLKPIVGASAAIVVLLAAIWANPVRADIHNGAPMNDLFRELHDIQDSAQIGMAKRVAREIKMEWAKSGSPSMDLLLKRGRDAMDEQDFDAAIDHFSALIDHAPGFAEGWHGRATAFFRSSQYGFAIGDLEQTLALNARHFGAIYGLAVILEQMGDIDRAYDIYQEVRMLYPLHPEATKALLRLEVRVNGTEL